MIYLFPTLTRYFMRCSLFTFLKKVSKKRHPSRIAPLSRSFGMTFSFIKNEAIANFELYLLQKQSLTVNNLPSARTLCRLRFFLFWLLFSLLSQYKKEKSDKRSLSFKTKPFEENK